MKFPTLSIIATTAAALAATAAAAADVSFSGHSLMHLVARKVDCGDSVKDYKALMDCYNDRAIRCAGDGDKASCFQENQRDCCKSQRLIAVRSSSPSSPCSGFCLFSEHAERLFGTCADDSFNHSRGGEMQRHLVVSPINHSTCVEE